MNDIKINYTNHNEVFYNLETRVCNKCGRVLPISSFRLMDNKVSTPYYLGQCKECEYAYQREYIENNQRIRFSDNLNILINREFNWRCSGSIYYNRKCLCFNGCCNCWNKSDGCWNRHSWLSNFSAVQRCLW